MSIDPAHDPTVLPRDLPVPRDDGAALHLKQRRVPDVALSSTDGEPVNLADLTSKPSVLFFYPRTGVPGQPPNLGFAGEEWDSIPGARGCTPQSCGFRDLFEEFRAAGVEVRGVSTSTVEHQREFVARMHMPFAMLSDAGLELTEATRLPTFAFPVESGGPTTLVRRMAWFCSGSRIRRVWYPVFPPQENAEEVVRWVRRRNEIRVRRATASDKAWIQEVLKKHWVSPTIWSLEKAYAADELPALVAERGGERVGLVTYSIQGRQCEVVTLNALEPGRGIGGVLMDAAVDAAVEAGCSRLFLTTSNDNVRALGFYQRWGMRLAAVHRGMIDRYRMLEPEIPRVSEGGLPVHDEIELELLLEQ